MENELLQLIKDVSIYLRKSRAKDGIETKDGMETDEILEKHKQELISFCEKYNFRYAIYQEVVSGDSISDRPEMIRLLQDVEDGLWDATLVVDIDRLGRGNEEDQGRIKRIYRQSETFIMTPTKIYNLENEDDETYLEFQTFLARQEFKIIKRRFRRGKKQGSKMGYWTNGTPPFPYEYNLDIKGLIINEEKLEIYNQMKDMFLNQLLNCKQIEWKLNQLGYLSPRGKNWTAKVIGDILKDETHLGKIISNKTKGNFKKGEKVKKIPRDKWIVVENCHPAVKTQEEHDKIIQILKNNSIKMTSRPKRVLSSLVQCGICGRIMQLHSNEYTTSLTCPGYSPIGEKCPCFGIKEDRLLNIILPLIDEYIDKNYQDNFSNNDKEIKTLNKQIDKLNIEYKKIEQSLNRIYQMREDGEYTKEEFLIRKEKRQEELNQITLKINNLQNDLRSSSIENTKQVVDNYKFYKDNWKDELDSEKKNYLLSQFVDKIIYIRTKEDKDNVKIQIKLK